MLFRSRAILPREGVEAFCRILDSDFSQVVVSTTDWLDRLKPAETLHGADESRESPQRPGAGRSTPTHARPTHARPNLTTAYVAPRNDVEKTLAEIWQTLIGVDRIGIHDSFFDLGGHSLLATGLITRVRDAFETDLTVPGFFEKPTIADLAERIVEELANREDSETLNKILDELEEGSDAEVPAATDAEHPFEQDRPR